MKKKKGFTLVEILAAVVILALLAIFCTVSVSSVLNNSREELLQDQIKSLGDAAITYVTDKNYYLKACSTSFNPESPTDTDKNCYKTIAVDDLVKEGFFENKNDICDVNKKVMVYKKNYTTYTEYASYVDEDICSY